MRLELIPAMAAPLGMPRSLLSLLPDLKYSQIIHKGGRMEQRIYKPGERLGHYEVIEHLATGGFSAIYRAKDLSDAQWAGHSALKACLYEPVSMPLARIAEYNRRIEREFRLVANLDHANIVKVLEHLNHRGLGLYAMELLEGPTLGRFLAEERRPLAVLMDIFEQLVEAVAFCHREGVVHRDIKPSNVLVTRRKKQKEQQGEDVSEVAPVLYERRGVLRTRWQPVLLDFGVSHALAEPPITAGGRVTGTYEYLSPEYARAILGRRLDPAWQGGPGDDVYALAVLLYEMLTGRLPARTPAENLVELLTEIRDAPPVHPGELNPEAPPALSELAMEGLRKRRGERPADGLELLHRLGEAIARDGERLRVLAPEYRTAAETTAVGEPGAPEVGGRKAGSGQVAATLGCIEEKPGQAPSWPQVRPGANALALPSPTAQMVELAQAFAAKLAEEATRVVGAAWQEAEWLTTAARLALREALWNRARRILREAHHRARSLVEEAQRTAQGLVEEAQRTAQGILREARRDAERITHQARWEVRRRYLPAVALILGILALYSVPWTRLIAPWAGAPTATSLLLPPPATPTGARSRVGRPVPKEPFKGQMRAPCVSPFTAINGGCYAGVTDDNHNQLRAPCPEDLYESAGYCFMPVGERGERLPSTVDP